MITYTQERRALQICIVLAATVPVAVGLWGVAHGFAGNWNDNHHRYLSGLLMAIGLGFWSSVPNIEAKTARLRTLAAIVVLGGLCRLFGVLLGDAPTPTVVGALAMELLVPPLLCLWQTRHTAS